MLTKVSRLFEEEKIEAVNQAVTQTAIQTAKQTRLTIAKNLLDIETDVLSVMKVTGLSKAEILKLQEELIEA